MAVLHLSNLLRGGLFLILLFLSTALLGLDFHDFDCYQKQLSKSYVENKILYSLEKDKKIRRFYRMTSQALYIGDFDRQQVDYILFFADTSHPPIQRRRLKRSLQDAKIAIDPGHFGGSYAELEERYIHIPAEQTKNHQVIRFDEGTLTYLTALYLKSLLEKEGATVYVTRSAPGTGAIEKSFSAWLNDHPALFNNKEPLSRLFRTYYNKEDLRARARLINEFSPDITVIIHYNAHQSCQEKARGLLVTKSNFNLTFIPGAFCANELATIEDRYEFVRLIVTDDVEQSRKLSRIVLRQCVTRLSVPILQRTKKTGYTSDVCLFQEPGIYSRNLVLTRLVHSPLCYGETLVQNNECEVYKLGTNDSMIEGYSCPKRIKEVARAYFHGIKNFFSR